MDGCPVILCFGLIYKLTSFIRLFNRFENDLPGFIFYGWVFSRDQAYREEAVGIDDFCASPIKKTHCNDSGFFKKVVEMRGARMCVS